MHPKFDFGTVTLPMVDASQSSNLCFIERETAKIAYDYEAPRAGRASQLLVLVNGFARPRADFRAFRKRIHTQMPELATLALDNRGAGDTVGGLENLTVETMAQDASFLARSYASALSLPGYHALGISMGGMICQVWAACDPCVQSVTLVSTTAGGSSRVWPPCTDVARVKEQGFPSWPKDFEGMHKRMVRYFGPKFRKASPLLIEMMVKNMLKAQGEASAHGKAEAQYNATVGFDGTRYAKTMSCPALVLTGTDDEIIPRENADALCALISQAKKIELEAMGHLLLIEDPENFVASVRSFIEGQAGG